MEEIIRYAKASYEDLSEEEKMEVEEMFKLMDKDGDGKVSTQEFKNHFRKEGDLAKVHSNLFNLIDGDGNGNLQFEEVLILYYIRKSGRPACEACGNFTKALFLA
ncbi:hypothetical protein L6164_016424 [Bauhinia variegata]|uniref:Uncharacterized protein n=1 Tax=Bauhinia variegata TaxID=167791 RepID=A0ACB9NSY9_BAUVA|nr:hypothetical protein L6164_016424 [Bauhinia variegata]